jgi:hypothetical protein
MAWCVSPLLGCSVRPRRRPERPTCAPTSAPRSRPRPRPGGTAAPRQASPRADRRTTRRCASSGSSSRRTAGLLKGPEKRNTRRGKAKKMKMINDHVQACVTSIRKITDRTASLFSQLPPPDSLPSFIISHGHGRSMRGGDPLLLFGQV